MKALLTHKVGMTSIITEDGYVTPITVLSARDNIVIGKRTLEKDGYSAVIVGTDRDAKISKSRQGILKQSQAKSKLIREFRLDDDTANIGDHLGVDIFNIGDKVSVSAISKGKGWAGTIKRHGFHRGRKTHGGRSYRRVGSIGSMYPQHILKGKKMAGRYGATKVSTKGLKIAYVDANNAVIGVAGAVPGPNKGLVVIKGQK
jgi:large subunit ribosomal protein L3